MLLHVRNVAKSYRQGGRTIPVLDGVSLTLDRAESVALTGESGSGKSTLLHLVGGLDAADSGEITLDGQPLAGLDDAGRAALRRSTVGIVFQQFNLVPSLTVGDNISFQARLAGNADPDWCQDVADRLGLSEHLAKYPEVLSGGQQQRVAIARTLAARPRLILADEPTGNLDEDTADTVLDLMLDAVRDTGTALLTVTHSPRIAAKHDRQLRLDHGRITP